MPGASIVAANTSAIVHLRPRMIRQSPQKPCSSVGRDGSHTSMPWGLAPVGGHVSAVSGGCRVAGRPEEGSGPAVMPASSSVRVGLRGGGRSQTDPDPEHPAEELVSVPEEGLDEGLPHDDDVVLLEIG